MAECGKVPVIKKEDQWAWDRIWGLISLKGTIEEEA